MRIPQNKQWVQTNRSDVLGNMQGSFNLDLTKVLAKVHVTRMITNVSGLNSYPAGFAYFASAIYTVQGFAQAGLVMATLASGQPSSLFSSVNVSGTPPTTVDSTLSDIKVFKNNLYVTAFGKLFKFDGATWTNVNIGTGSEAGPWMMCVYANTLYITSNTGSGSKIYSTTDGSTIVTPVNAGALDLGIIDLKITFLLPSGDRIWFGTININNGLGYMYEWDGAATQPTRSYPLESAGSLAGVIKSGVPYIVDTQGKILKYSNGVFIEVGRFPINDKMLASATNAFNARFIHPNGAALLNGKPCFNISNMLADGVSVSEFCPSGVWELDEPIFNTLSQTYTGAGLYHKYSFSYTPTGTNTITDYGQNIIVGAGALVEFKIPTNITVSSNGSFLAGATLYSSASAQTSGIFFNDTFEAVSGTAGQFSTDAFGYLVTTKIYSQGIKDTFQQITAYYKTFLASTNGIFIKFRTNDPQPTIISITWLDSKTFTTTSNVLGLEKYEVEGIQGPGSGKCGHISSIDNNNTFYTVHLTDAFSGVTTGTAKVRIQNWIKIKTDADKTEQFTDFAIDTGAARWIQFKICMLFKYLDEFEGADISTKVHKYVP